MLDGLKAVVAATSLAVVLAAAPGMAAAATNLVANGGFETANFSGWTATAVSRPQTVVTYPVYEGRFAAQIEGEASGPNTLSQVISTMSGQSYDLSFWYLQADFLPNGLSASWNGSTIFSVTDETIGAYQQFSATVFGSGSDVLVFTAYNDQSNTFLDEVSVTAVSAVPEPGAWAMMIVGFGASGSMMRRSRRRSAPLAP